MPLPVCKCNPICSCGAVSAVKKYRDQTYTIRFLKGLNDQYSHVRSQIMLIDPLPIINKAFSLITQQERQLLSDLVLVTESHSFNINSDQSVELSRNGDMHELD